MAADNKDNKLSGSRPSGTSSAAQPQIPTSSLASLSASRVLVSPTRHDPEIVDLISKELAEVKKELAEQRRANLLRPGSLFDNRLDSGAAGPVGTKLDDIRSAVAGASGNITTPSDKLAALVAKATADKAARELKELRSLTPTLARPAEDITMPNRYELIEPEVSFALASSAGGFHNLIKSKTVKQFRNKQELLFLHRLLDILINEYSAGPDSITVQEILCEIAAVERFDATNNAIFFRVLVGLDGGIQPDSAVAKQNKAVENHMRVNDKIEQPDSGGGYRKRPRNRKRAGKGPQNQQQQNQTQQKQQNPAPKKGGAPTKAQGAASEDG